MTKISRRALLGTALALPAAGAISNVFGQTRTIQYGVLVPLSGLYARAGTMMRVGAEMAIADINASGGIKALGGAKLELVALDSGDTTEKAKNAAQRMVASYPNLVAASGAYLSSFSLAVTEVTERARLPVLTLSYSELITSRGFKYVFQTSAPAGAQAAITLPMVMQLAQSTTGKRPKTVAIITDNTGSSIASVKAMKEGLLDQVGLTPLLLETYTPPITDATWLIQQVRTRRPDLLFFLPTIISDAKLVLEKMTEFRLHIPTVSFGMAIAEPDVLNTVSPVVLEGLMAAVANWGFKGHERLIKRLKEQYHEPWMTQNQISTYGDIWLIKAALENAGVATREAVARALHTMDAGPSIYYPGGRLKFDDKGRREGAQLTIIQWQDGVPVTVFPAQLAMATPRWRQ